MHREATPRLALLLAASALLAGCVQLGPRFDAPEPVEPHEATPGNPSSNASGSRETPADREGEREEPEPTPPADPEPEPDPEAEPEPEEDEPASPVPSQPRAVVALIDSGINPYHVEFRDDSPEAYLHPSTYLPTYPKDARPLHLTLDAGSLAEALEADAGTWDEVEAGTLYYIPGTRIIGLLSVGRDGDRRGFDENGHGTMTASRAAGETTSLAPTAKIVAIEGLGSRGVGWAADQPWIDVQSNSWIDLVPLVGAEDERNVFRRAAKTQIVLAAAGNGLAQIHGGVGQPALLASTAGADGVIAVGGHDNGRYTPWSGTLPHVAADACWSWAADAGTLDKTGPRVGTGTSASAPYVAGAAARLILEARHLLGDANVSHEGGILARGPEGKLADGPLADGDFTLEELKNVLLKTADPRAAPTHHDGDLCDGSMTPYNTAPVGPGDVPQGDAPPAGYATYYHLGYGAVNTDTVNLGIQVLLGAVDLPDRRDADQFFAAERAARALIG